MFELLRAQSKSATGAILYVTIGTLLVIWAGLYRYYFLTDNSDAPVWQHFACLGTILSGIAIAAIGLLFGLIGRSAKNADTTVGVAPAGPIAPVMTGAVAGGVVSAAPVMERPLHPQA